MQLKNVCIEENVKVIVKDFLPLLIETLHEHNIKTQRYLGRNAEQNCDYFLRYTALQSWDYVPYLSFAEIILLDHNLNQQGYAKYELLLKGGYDFRKYKSVRQKIKPLVQELFQNY